jgi:hypothetical protein
LTDRRPLLLAASESIPPALTEEGKQNQKKPALRTIWRQSQRTLKRLLIYVIPTFVVMATLEYFRFFSLLARKMPTLFSLKIFPPEAMMIVSAQALNLYNGAIAAANFIHAGSITPQQAVMIILLGSLITAPIRTLKHALPTYISILGARPGLIMAVSTQVLRILFLLICTAGLMAIWR